MSQRRVLLVEDETGLAASISGVLTSAGLNVEYAGDGEEALSRMRGRGRGEGLRVLHLNVRLIHA